MSYREFSQHLARTGLSIREFADRVRMNKNSITNYSGGDVSNSLAVIVVLMAYLHDNRLDTKDILANLDIAPNGPRGDGFGKFGGDPQRSFLHFPNPKRKESVVEDGEQTGSNN